MSLCLRKRILSNNLLGIFFRYSSTTTEIVETNDQVLIDDSDEALAREAELEKKRNKSRLNPAHFNVVNGKVPYEIPLCTAHYTVKYNRKLYGKYGVDSGVNPSICWPTRQDLADIQERESVAYPYTIQEMMVTAAEKRKLEKEAIDKRQADIAAKFAKLEQWKKELKNKIEKKTAEVEAAKEKKERLVEEVRRHFGFKLDPRDERFQEMLAKKEKEQKKLEKQAKKDAKEKAMLAKLQQKNVELSEKA